MENMAPQCWLTVCFLSTLLRLIKCETVREGFIRVYFCSKKCEQSTVKLTALYSLSTAWVRVLSFRGVIKGGAGVVCSLPQAFIILFFFT